MISSMDRIVVEAYDSAPPGWDEFADAHPHGKVYHKAAWHKIIRQSFGHPTQYLVVKCEGRLSGIFPLTAMKSLIFGSFGISLPFINYGGPLLENGSLMKPLAQYLLELRERQKYDYIEIRSDQPLETSLPAKRHKVTFFLDLPADSEELLNAFKAKLRSQIRRPSKEGMEARCGGGELLNDFYKVFAINMRDLGTPVLPRSFFKNILNALKNSYICVVYEKGGSPVAASFLIQYRDQMEIPWASSLRQYNRFSPNMLLYWSSLKLAIEKGCRCFDFGRCSPEGSTYRFKKQWGAREEPLFWYYVLPPHAELPQLNPDNGKYSLPIKIWTKLPVAVTKVIGPRVIRYIP